MTMNRRRFLRPAQNGRPQDQRGGVVRLAAWLLCLLLILPGATRLRAEEFRRFSVLIPDGWEVTESSAEMLLIRSPDRDAVAVVICAAVPDTRTPRDILEAYVRYFSGSEPQRRKDGSHIFSFERADTRLTALFREDARTYLLLILSDPANRYPECLDMLMSSLTLRKDTAATP